MTVLVTPARPPCDRLAVHEPIPGVPDVKLAEEFPLDPGLCYLNHAAVGPWPRRSAEAVKAFADENAREGASHYPRWQARTRRLRERLADLIGAADPDDIALMKNTSEALSVVAWGQDWREGDNVVLARQEFPSNRMVWEALERLGVAVRLADLDDPAGPEAALMDAVDERTRLLTVSSVQYGDGLRMDLERLGAFCRDRDIRFCVDAIQSLGALRFDLAACHADFVVADGHKWMLGPEGLAVFWCRPALREQMRLYEHGWLMVDDPFNFDQPDWRPSPSARRFEPGSPNTLGVFALEASLSLLQEVGIGQVEQELLERTAWLLERIEATEGLRLLSPAAPERRSGIVTFAPSEGDIRSLFRHLLEQRVICAQRGGGIRLSPHFYTGYDKLEHVMALAREWLKKTRETPG